MCISRYSIHSLASSQKKYEITENLRSQYGVRIELRTRLERGRGSCRGLIFQALNIVRKRFRDVRMEWYCSIKVISGIFVYGPI